MTDVLPTPLTPAECDLRGLPYMPLKIEQLQKSKSWLICKRRPELAFYLVNLWCRAWQEVPAGSLEDDDDALADIAKCDPRRWAKLRTDVMRGWIKCSDGRLYHRVVSEIAHEVWEERKKYRARTQAARAEKERKRRAQAEQPATDIETGDVTGSVARSVTDDVTALKGREGEGKDKGKGKKEREERERASPSAPPAPEPRATRLTIEALPDDWRAFCVENRPDLDPERTWHRFRDYWIAKPGKDGRKLDWLATWRNWIRREDAGPQRVLDLGNGQQKSSSASRGRDVAAAALAAGERLDRDAELRERSGLPGERARGDPGHDR